MILTRYLSSSLDTKKTEQMKINLSNGVYMLLIIETYVFYNVKKCKSTIENLMYTFIIVKSTFDASDSHDVKGNPCELFVCDFGDGSFIVIVNVMDNCKLCLLLKCKRVMVCKCISYPAVFSFKLKICAN